MQITQITVRRSVKVNLGNFENTDFEITLTANINPAEEVLSDEPRTALLWAKAGFLLRDELQRKRFKTEGYGLE